MNSRSSLLAVVLVAGATALGAQDQVYRPGPDVTNPVPTKQVQPKYTTEAMRARVQGYVVLEAVVRTDGTVTDVRVVKSLDPGLDARAIEAAKAWLFKPGLRNGKMVPVIVRFELEFRMHGAPPTPIQGEDAFLNGAYAIAPGLTAPAVKMRVEPAFAGEAIPRKIFGVLELEVVVGEDGKVARARVKTSLDKAIATTGLDQQALDAVAQWLYEPGQLPDGQKVPVVTVVRLEYKPR